jgi:hypothetical protein
MIAHRKSEEKIGKFIYLSINVDSMPCVTLARSLAPLRSALLLIESPPFLDTRAYELISTQRVSLSSTALRTSTNANNLWPRVDISPRLLTSFRGGRI